MEIAICSPVQDLKKKQFEFRFFFITEFFAKNNVPLILLYNYDKKIKESLPDLNK